MSTGSISNPASVEYCAMKAEEARRHNAWIRVGKKTWYTPDEFKIHTKNHSNAHGVTYITIGDIMVVDPRDGIISARALLDAQYEKLKKQEQDLVSFTMRILDFYKEQGKK